MFADLRRKGWLACRKQSDVPSPTPSLSGVQGCLYRGKYTCLCANRSGQEGEVLLLFSSLNKKKNPTQTTLELNLEASGCGWPRGCSTISVPKWLVIIYGFFFCKKVGERWPLPHTSNSHILHADRGALFPPPRAVTAGWGGVLHHQLPACDGLPKAVKYHVNRYWWS